jgi:two-component system LytT family sensor kinase
MTESLRKKLRTGALYFAIWSVAGLFLSTQSLTQKVISREPTPWWHYVTSWLVGVYIWALLTPVVIRLGRRFPIGRKNWPWRVTLHSLLSVAVSIGQLVAEAAVLSRLGIFPAIMTSFAATLVFLLVIGFHQGVMTYWTLLGAHFAVQSYRRYQERQREALRLELRASELQTQLANAQLSALKMQLQPHFLFNTLNAIMVLVRQQRGREAEEMLARLSDLLRAVLDDVEAQEVPLRRELEYLKLYLGIEQVRFQDRLRIEIAAEPEALEASVPHMGLHPLVENAIRHGIGRRSAAGRIRISARREGEALEIRIEDDGPGIGVKSGAAGRGIGLANTRARLEQLYGAAGQLSVENGAQGGAVATMALPYHVAPGEPESELVDFHADDADRG